jgi:hypothetical protein
MITQIADELVSTVQESARRLRSLDAEAVSHRPAPDRWTIKEVLGHLIDSATNNHHRFVRAQFVKEFVFPKYQQNEWVRCQAYDDCQWEDLIDLWLSYNVHLAHVIRHIPADALSVRCLIGDYDPVTLEFLVEDYLVHLKHHLQKIAERAVAN